MFGESEMTTKVKVTTADDEGWMDKEVILDIPNKIYDASLNAHIITANMTENTYFYIAEWIQSEHEIIVDDIEIMED